MKPNKTVMPVFACRLPSEAITEMEEIADRQYIPLRTLARVWLMQRLDAEKAYNPAPDAKNLAVAASGAGIGMHQTADGDDADV